MSKANNALTWTNNWLPDYMSMLMEDILQETLLASIEMHEIIVAYITIVASNIFKSI